MLTQSEFNLLPYMMLLRSTAIECLYLLKMRPLVPIEVKDKLTGYTGIIVEMVFDPQRVAEVNEQFRAKGYPVPEDMSVIAVNNGGTILMWGGLNSVFWLRKSKPIKKGEWDKHLAFQDLGGLIYVYGCKIKNKKRKSTR